MRAHRPPAASTRVRVAGRVALAVTFALVTAGCGGDPSSTGSTASSDGPASSSASSSASSTATASPSAGDPSESAGEASSAAPSASAPSASLTADPGPAGRLLTAEQLPGFNEDYRWREAATGPEQPSRSFGTCQRFSILSIGAEQAIVRRFRPADGTAAKDRAGELVATFPDTATARRAYAVLEAWRAKCADRLSSYRRHEIGRTQPVTVAGGRAGWYLLTYGPVKGDPDAQFFDAQGAVLEGRRIAMVSLELAGQDYNYERGQEPMVAALQRAAQKL